MPEPLSGNRDNMPLPQNFEVNQRDIRDKAAREAQKLVTDRFESESRNRVETQDKRRAEITAKTEDDKSALREKESVKQTQEIQDKRRAQDKTNPDSGNIINVIV